MDYSLHIKASANADLQEIIAFYRAESICSADDFLSCLDILLKRLVKTPFIYQKAYRSVRRTPMGKFPYSVFYIVKNDKIFISAIVHQKRSPAVWKKRVIH